MSELAKFAARLRTVEGTVRGLATVPQLAASSIVDGAVDQIVTVQVGIDELGNPIFEERLVSRYGQQADGSNTMVVFTGPVPPRPVGHTVTGGPGSLSVEWYGEFEDRIEPYDDHDFVAVHVGTTAGYTPTADTLKATIRARQGERVTIGGLTTGTYYVSLVAVSQAGIWGQASPFTAGDSTDPAGVDVVAREAAAAAHAAATAAQGSAENAHLTAESAQQAADQALADALAAQQAAQAAQAEANAAALAAIEAQEDATTALTAANGVNRLWYGTVPPGAGDGKDGDTWWVRDPTNGKVTGAYEKRNGAWSPRTITSQVIDSVTAGQITTGTLQAGVSIKVGDPGGAHIAIGGTSLVTYRPNPDGELVAATVIGGATDDVIQIVDPSDGSTMAGFFNDGSGSARDFSANRMFVNGWQIGDSWDPYDLLWTIPRGAVGSYQTFSPGGVAGTSPLGVIEVSSWVQTGRLYRVTFSGALLWGTTGGIVRLQLTDTFDGSAPMVTPQAGRTARFFANEHMSINSSKQVNFSAYFMAPDTGQPGDWFTYRCLFSTWAAFGGYTVQAFAGSGMPMSMLVEDLGPMGGQFMKSGQASGGGGSTSGGTTVPAPPTEVKTQTETYNATWVRAFRGDGSYRTDTGDVMQGYNSANGIQKSMIGFPAKMQTDLAGSTVSKVEAYLYAYHWHFASGGDAVFGVHGASSAPSSFSYSGSYTVNKWARDRFRWVTLPSSWNAGFASGSSKGITVGGGLTSNALNWYGRFYGTGWNVSPKLRVTFTK